MRHQLDFEVYTRGAAEKLIIIDHSNYYERPSNLIVEVTFPNFNKVYSTFLNVGSVTVLSTETLGFSTGIVDFPDGLYKIRMSVQPNVSVYVCKNYMKTDGTVTKLRKRLQKECLSKEELDSLYDVDKYLSAAIATENTNSKDSIEFKRQADKELNKQECNGKM